MSFIPESVSKVPGCFATRRTIARQTTQNLMRPDHVERGHARIKEESDLHRCFSFRKLLPFSRPAHLATTETQSNGALASRVSGSRRLVVIHEDDVAMTHGANAAFAELSAIGTCSAGSVMVPCPWFPEAAEMAANNRMLDVGVHLTLTSEGIWRGGGGISGHAYQLTLALADHRRNRALNRSP
jgi:YdjC-like protein